MWLNLENNPRTVLNEAPRQPRILEEAKVSAPSIAIGYQCIRLVEHVEPFQPKLHLYAFSEAEILEHGHIRAEVARTGKMVTPRVSVAELVAGKVVVADRTWVGRIGSIGERSRIQEPI